MNGPARKIEILAPFNQAIELTRLMLFRPFDSTKWLVIGFAAFLGGWFNSGGGGINPLGFRNWNASHARPATFEFRSFNVDHAGVLFLTALVVSVIVVLFLAVLWLWIVARGRFVFIDCVVRNRAAISEPWREFREEGNRFFVFQLVLLVASMVIMALLAGLMIGFFILWKNYHISSTPALFVVVPVAVFLWVAFGVVVNVIIYFMPPVMYARRCSPVDAARAILQLIFDDPAPFIFFIFFMIALWIGWLIAGCLVTCLTCCVATLPYIGTVIVLPIPVLFRSFSLLFLRQFGPEWDVWTRVAAPAATAPPPVEPTALTPPPPPATEQPPPPASPTPPESPVQSERSPYEPPESTPPPPG
jgi:hypothetical protein